MKTNLLFNFTVNNEKNSIVINKEFAAPKTLVWDAWTQAELLDKWWAPLPYQNKTVSMLFEEGGCWFYAMISPQGEKHYCKANYKTIKTHKMFMYKDAFCDENGKDNLKMPNMEWTANFVEIGIYTTVNIVVQFESEEKLQEVIAMGFKDGFTAGMNQLEQMLTK